MRDHALNELTALAEKDERIYLITGDLGYVVLDRFRERCQGRYINAGIAEQNMTALAAGMAREGNIVFTYSIGNFPTLRCTEQIRNDVCYHNANVKILAVGGGFVYGNQGITHHATEDIAIMRTLPNMRVYVPGDAYEAVECIREAYAIDGPAYIRLARNKEENFHQEAEKLDIKKLLPFGEIGKSINILTTGAILCEGIKLQKMLTQKYSIGLFSVPRIKPMDENGLIELAITSKLLITIEEHQAMGGFGSACAEVISTIPGEHAVLYRSGLRNIFSEETGDQQYLREFYGISANTIAPMIEKILGGKN